MKKDICENIYSSNIPLSKINISRLIIDLIGIQILWRTLNILENAEANHEKCIQMWLL